MIPYVLSNHLCCHLVANGSGKISLLQKLFTPQLFLYIRILLKYYTGSDALEHSYHLGYAVPRGKLQKDTDMVLFDLKAIYLKAVMYGNLLKDLFRSFSNISAQDPLSIFRSQFHVIFHVIDRMAGALQLHAVGIAYVFLSSSGELFIFV